MRNSYLDEFYSKVKTTPKGEPVLTLKPTFLGPYFSFLTLLILSGILSVFLTIPVFLLIMICSTVLRLINIIPHVSDGAIFAGIYALSFVTTSFFIPFFIKRFVKSLEIKVFQSELEVVYSFPFFCEKNIKINDITSIENSNYIIDRKYNPSVVVITTEGKRTAIIPGLEQPGSFIELIKTLKNA